MEISVFGGGNSIGECTVLELGNNNWFIIDSFIDINSKIPIAQKYLESKGISFDEVKGIIATHWHDDHIQGMAKLLELCQKAEFYTSGAFNHQELEIIISIDKEIQARKKSLSEFRQIISIIKERKSNLNFVDPDRLIEKFKNNGSLIELISLAPSDNAKLRCYHSFKSIINSTDSSNAIIPNPKPNENSIVLLLKIDKLEIVLGGDLEDSSNSKLGWNDVLARKHCPKKTVSLFKIPHHGSQTAYNERVWQCLFSTDPYSVLTPYNKLRNPIPRKSDINNIRKHSTKCYITSNPNTSREVKIDRTAQKVLDRLNISIRSLKREYGQVRFLPDFQNQDWKVKLSGNAMHVDKLY